MRLPAAAFTLALIGCAPASAWRFHDSHGWPVQTYQAASMNWGERLGCGRATHGGVIVAPDAYSTDDAVLAYECGQNMPGWHARTVEDLDARNRRVASSTTGR